MSGMGASGYAEFGSGRCCHVDRATHDAVEVLMVASDNVAYASQWMGGKAYREATETWKRLERAAGYLNRTE